MATYKFYYSVHGSSVIQQQEYISSYNILNVKEHFLKEIPNIDSVYRIDILADPDKINTDEALGYK